MFAAIASSAHSSRSVSDSHRAFCASRQEWACEQGTLFPKARGPKVDPQRTHTYRSCTWRYDKSTTGSSGGGSLHGSVGQVAVALAALVIGGQRVKSHAGGGGMRTGRCSKGGNEGRQAPAPIRQGVCEHRSQVHSEEGLSNVTTRVRPPTFATAHPSSHAPVLSEGVILIAPLA